MTSSEGAPSLNVFAKPEVLAVVQDSDDLALLQLIGQRKKNADRADAAWKIFYDRYKGWLWTKCRKLAFDLGGETWVEDIFLDTMEAVYLYANRFHLPSDIAVTAAVPHIKAWLGKITNTNLRKRLEGHYDEVTLEGEQWARYRAPEETEEPVQKLPTAEQEAFHAAFNALSEREQIVLRVTFQYHRFGKKFQRLPNRVVSDLAEQLGTTAENLRTIRTRALRKLRVAVATIPPPQPHNAVEQ